MGLIRLVKEAKAAGAINDALEDAAKETALYGEASWWRRVLTAAGALAVELPLSKETRLVMNNALAKMGMIAGTVVAVAGALQSAPGIPAKYQGIASLVGSFAMMLAGFAHPSPAQQ